MPPAFGLSSYFLWTQKGATVLPLVRGSGFLVKFDLLSSFYKYHVLTAGHVACPIRYPGVFGGDSPGLRAIGERHITTGMLFPSSEPQGDGDVAAREQRVHASTNAGKRAIAVPLAFPQKRFLNLDVAALRIKNEDEVIQRFSPQYLQPLELDAAPIAQGERLEFHGVQSSEEQTNPNDDGLSVASVSFEGECHSALVSLDYGTVLLAKGACTPHPSLCGGPVLRRSNGKCVGVIVARVMCRAPPAVRTETSAEPVDDNKKPAGSPSEPAGVGRPMDMQSLTREPWLDISGTKELEPVASELTVAFVPVREFMNSLRRSEM